MRLIYFGTRLSEERIEKKLKCGKVYNNFGIFKSENNSKNSLGINKMDGISNKNIRKCRAWKIKIYVIKKALVKFAGKSERKLQ